MRTFLVVAGILLVLWLGFQAIDRNRTNDTIDGHEQRIEQLENERDNNNMPNDILDEDNPIDKSEDKLDKKEDDFDKNMEMPYEKKNTNENTDLLPSDEPQNNNRGGKVKKPNPAKAEPEANATESIVAFGYVDDGMFEPDTEAFQLNLFETAFLGEESVTAFQLK